MSAGDAVHHAPGLLQLAPLIAAWVGFALFSILGSVFVGLHADASRIAAAWRPWGFISSTSCICP
jgi:hypothetical protein